MSRYKELKAAEADAKVVVKAAWDAADAAYAKAAAAEAAYDDAIARRFHSCNS